MRGASLSQSESCLCRRLTEVKSTNNCKDQEYEYGVKLKEKKKKKNTTGDEAEKFNVQVQRGFERVKVLTGMTDEDGEHGKQSLPPATDHTNVCVCVCAPT